MAFANGTFVIASQLGVSTSATGSSWSSQPLAAAENLVGLAYGNGTWVMGDDRFLNSDVVSFFVSSSGATWTQQSLGSATDLGLLAVTYGNGVFVAVTNSGKAYRSADGVTWTKATVNVNAMYGVAFGNGVFVAVGNAGSIFTSPDAATWTRRTWSGPNAAFEDVAFGNAQFVAAGDSFAESR